MDFKKFLAIGLAVGIAANIADSLVHGQLLADFYAHPPFRQGVNPGWMILGDLVAGFVFAWFYLAVAGSFAPGVAGGATMGFYTGVLVIFPAAIFYVPDVRGVPVLPLLDLDRVHGRLVRLRRSDRGGDQPALTHVRDWGFGIGGSREDFELGLSTWSPGSRKTIIPD